MSAKFAGKVALVTGASAGIGRAAALALAQHGADVAINYLTYPEQAEELAGQLRGFGRRALLCPVDVSDQAAVEHSSFTDNQAIGGVGGVGGSGGDGHGGGLFTATSAGPSTAISLTHCSFTGNQALGGLGGAGGNAGDG